MVAHDQLTDVPAELDRLLANYGADLPLRMEMDAVARVLATLELGPVTCLDLGAENPAASRTLRKLGGYWSSAVWSARQRRLAATLLSDEVLQVGVNGELPYEDKQFDVVVLGSGRLVGDRRADEALVQECHRVLKTPGYLILSGNYRKPGALTSLLALCGQRSLRSGFNESQLFDLLKNGFDVLGIKTYCRFWVQLVSQCASRPGWRPRLIKVLYRIALQLDVLLFFTKGYRVLAYGRRKGWRPRQSPVLSGGLSLTEAVLRRSPR
jgi:SAM-dependent methyltransferase